MDPAFWQERWRDNRIAFHQSTVNESLVAHWPQVCPDPKATVFVPLSGKSLDMVWLAQRGHRVIGVELSKRAVDAFFAENAISSSTSETEAFEIRHGVVGSGQVEIWCGDFFAFPGDVLRDAKAAYDRASLIALPSDMRGRYAQKLSDLMPRSASILLLTINYDQSKMDGPPFSVPDEEVERLFADRHRIERVATRDAMPANRNLADRGLDAARATVFILAPPTPVSAVPA